MLSAAGVKPGDWIAMLRDRQRPAARWFRQSPPHAVARRTCSVVERRTRLPDLAGEGARRV